MQFRDGSFRATEGHDEEWLWALGMKEEVINSLRISFAQETPIAASLNDAMRKYLLQYTVVRGIPEAVKTLIQTHDMRLGLQVQRGIVDGYRADMIKYATII